MLNRKTFHKHVFASEQSERGNLLNSCKSDGLPRRNFVSPRCKQGHALLQAQRFPLFRNNARAFTLAEVLITLGIIGIVAALTIPTLVNNYQKQQYVTSLKKAYTEFNQVLQQISADYGCVGDLRCTGLFTNDSDSSKLGAVIVNQYKVAKNCGTAINKGCLGTINVLLDGKGYSYNR